MFRLHESGTIPEAEHLQNLIDLNELVLVRLVSELMTAMELLRALRIEYGNDSHNLILFIFLF